MNTPTSEGRFDRARLIEQACDRFERGLRAGPARPDDFLGTVPEALRPELLAELRELEAYHHRAEPEPTHVAPDTPAVSHPTMRGGPPAPRVDKVKLLSPRVPGY